MAAQTAPGILPEITTPDRVQTSSARFDLKDGAPSNSLRGASAYAIRQGFLSIGATDNSVVISPVLMASKSPLLTANADTV